MFSQLERQLELAPIQYVSIHALHNHSLIYHYLYQLGLWLNSNYWLPYTCSLYCLMQMLSHYTFFLLCTPVST